MTSRSPRVVFGLPAYNRPASLPETLESILSQTCRDFLLVVVDDSTTEATGAVVREYQARDTRIVYEKNPSRLGMVENWKKAFVRGRELAPRAEFFAWVSDHDVWHPRWLEALVGELDRSPRVVLAYPMTMRAFKNSRPLVNRGFETTGVADPVARLQLATLRMRPGNLIYGLFRADALARAGVFRRVLLPDRQVLAELALFGQFKQVPELLWYREVFGNFSLGRQRSALFASRVPSYLYLPVWVTHVATLVWDLTIRGRGKPEIGRLRGIRTAWALLVATLRLEMRRSQEPIHAAQQRVSRLFRAASHATSGVERAE
jgi:glycosyltransferase involved in cell wall biosynthesis